jgi:hypothetical protein
MAGKRKLEPESSAAASSLPAARTTAVVGEATSNTTQLYSQLQPAPLRHSPKLSLLCSVYLYRRVFSERCFQPARNILFSSRSLIIQVFCKPEKERVFLMIKEKVTLC